MRPIILATVACILATQALASPDKTTRLACHFGTARAPDILLNETKSTLIMLDPDSEKPWADPTPIKADFKDILITVPGTRTASGNFIVVALDRTTGVFTLYSEKPNGESKTTNFQCRPIKTLF